MNDPQKNNPQKTIILGSGKGKKTTPALLLNTTAKNSTGFSVDGLLIIEANYQRNLQRLPLQDDASLVHFKSLPTELVRIIKQLTAAALRQQEAKSDSWYEANESAAAAGKAAFVQRELQLYVHHILQQLKPFGSLIKWYYQAVDDMLVSTSIIKPAAISLYQPQVCFDLVRTDGGILRLLACVNINDQFYPVTDFVRYGFLLRSRNEFFLLSPADAGLLDQFLEGYVDAPAQLEDTFIKETVNPLADKYPVNRQILLQRVAIEATPQCRVYLSELNNSFLMITPRWVYGDFEIEDNEPATVEITKDSTVYQVKRDTAAEKTFITMLRAQHKRFDQQSNGYFYLPFAEAEKSQWLVKFYRKITDHAMPVYGMETLQHFRYNPHVPVISFHFNGKGIDWFDLQVAISFGDQAVALADLQKAIINGQQHLVLKDGTIGAIPEEWHSKYAMLLKLGQSQKNNLRLSKLHWTLSDDIDGGAAIMEQVISQQQQQKWQRLQQEESVYTLPSSINAQLRNYQLAGFNWMCLLDEMQWGGCLADDMGLGKTLQTISFLQYLADNYKNETHLVICPTSLMYNWESELKKFAPHLRYHIYHGANRAYDAESWKKANLVITSYGTARSDVEQLATFPFGYIMLDESQSIKNPASQVTKALQQLQSRNRLILSGTPIQNNTFDLYAQMQFINPGLLGNREFFKATFANPIDKYGDADATQRLRKLIYPFLLRRTKEQVAKDLPPKTEIILWCEMGEAQRRIYDAVKTQYRESLLERIEQEGMGASTIFLLEGLTRLRQICNSPQLLPDADNQPPDSIKLEELVREIAENSGSHKALVFSQFTGMLALIKTAMQEKQIPYLYLDGSTPATERQQLVQRFQEEAGIKVFLISLKAGGVGLTLTAADYVYLVDPWWNPAAEQQAIDRTHRIGQQNKVFAYKMICKDSVEEKILALQQRKKALAEDLVTEDHGFIKKLTPEDVTFLFS